VYDTVIIENIGTSLTSIPDFSQILQKKVWKVNHDHLKMSLLLVRMYEEERAFALAKHQSSSTSDVKVLKRALNRNYSEIVRRIMTGVSIFTFTLMGAVFGMGISRNRSNKGIIYVIAMTALYLISFFYS